jgi:hypothetical protein
MMCVLDTAPTKPPNANAKGLLERGPFVYCTHKSALTGRDRWGRLCNGVLGLFRVD